MTIKELIETELVNDDTILVIKEKGFTRSGNWFQDFILDTLNRRFSEFHFKDNRLEITLEEEDDDGD